MRSRETTYQSESTYGQVQKSTGHTDGKCTQFA